jgi:hypothetical protein
MLGSFWENERVTTVMNEKVEGRRRASLGIIDDARQAQRVVRAWLLLA